MDALLDFRVGVSLDGEALTAEEIERLLASTDGLALLRGKWVEVDPRAAAGRRSTSSRQIERLSRRKACPFGAGDASAGGRRRSTRATPTRRPRNGRMSRRAPGSPRRSTAAAVPEGLPSVDPGDALQGDLAALSGDGVRWLYLLVRLGLGACLADDMGLGKTIQVLALLLTLDQHAAKPKSAEPAGRARFAARQLGARRPRASRRRLKVVDRASRRSRRRGI